MSLTPGNRGASEASFEHLVYLDDDELIDKGWLEAFAGAFRWPFTPIVLSVLLNHCSSKCLPNG